MSDRRPRLPGGVRAALWGMAGIAVAAAVVSFGESYVALYSWARAHGLPGWRAWLWPLQVDSFLALGELAVYVSVRLRWGRRSRITGWITTGAGLAVSVAANVGHISGPDLWLDRLSAAIPPLAAVGALTFSLGVLRRLHEPRGAGREAPRAVRRRTAQRTRLRVAAADTGQPTRELARRLGVSPRTARRYRQPAMAPGGGDRAAR